MPAASVPARRTTQQSGVRERLGRVPRWAWLVGLAIAVGVLWWVFRTVDTLPHDERHWVFQSLTEFRTSIDRSRRDNPVLVFLAEVVRIPLGAFVDLCREVLETIGWLGVTAVAGMLGFSFGGLRVGLLALGAFLAFGVLGLWPESMDTLALTFAAVILSLLIGFPLGIWAGRSDRVMRALSPILDVMQILPTFAYLAPLVLLFLIGPASAVIATMIYAVPTTIRITALGLRGVNPSTMEAAVSLGATRWQTLRKVQLPMARRTLVLAINQTMMMALAMVVITALISAPGLGASIVKALQSVDVGEAFQAGLAIVVMAVVLDRLTSAAADRSEARRGVAGSGGLAGSEAARREAAKRRRWTLVVAGVGLVAVGVSLVLGAGSAFPAEVQISLADPVNAVSDWVKTTFVPLTSGLKDGTTYAVINPLQDALTTSPWWLVVAAVAGLALLVAGARAAVTAGVCLVGIAWLGLWNHGMITLATTLVATAITLAIGVLAGIAAHRWPRYAAAQRPLLDAAQTMPAFVYLLPALALFGPTRFTAIVASFIYAAPSVIRLTEDGLRGVPAGVVEAATSAGATARQLLWKVQLPMARPSLLLAANQGIVLVLAMVVVGGLVGGGALGFDVVSGFSQRSDFGKGLAAGAAIVLLGVMLDRITQAAGVRQRRSVPKAGDASAAPAGAEG
jgi:glycine betaine/proline transport system permease protein